jgi:transposase-like protein
VKYPDELKKKVVRTVIEEGPGTAVGRSIAEISRSLGVSESYFYQLKARWEPEVRAEMAAEAASQSNTEEPMPPEEAEEEAVLEMVGDPSGVNIFPSVRSVQVSIDIPEFMFPLGATQLIRLTEFVQAQLEEQLGE